MRQHFSRLVKFIKMLPFNYLKPEKSTDYENFPEGFRIFGSTAANKFKAPLKIFLKGRRYSLEGREERYRVRMDVCT